MSTLFPTLNQAVGLSPGVPTQPNSHSLNNRFLWSKAGGHEDWKHLERVKRAALRALQASRVAGSNPVARSTIAAVDAGFAIIPDRWPSSGRADSGSISVAAAKERASASTAICCMSGMTQLYFRFRPEAIFADPVNPRSGPPRTALCRATSSSRTSPPE